MEIYKNRILKSYMIVILKLIVIGLLTIISGIMLFLPYILGIYPHNFTNNLF